VALSPNHCYLGNATILSLSIFFSVYVTVNNLKLYSFTKKQQCIPFVLLFSFKIFLLHLTTISIKHPELVYLRYPADKLHFLTMLYCFLRPVRFYHIFFTLLHQSPDFRKKKLLPIIWNSIFSTILFSNIPHSKENSTTCYHKHIHSTPASCPIFLSGFKPSSILSTDFRKILKYQISLKSVQWRACCCMLSDRQTEGRT
jgi:hypothetical protein